MQGLHIQGMKNSRYFLYSLHYNPRSELIHRPNSWTGEMWKTCIIFDAFSYALHYNSRTSHTCTCRERKTRVTFNTFSDSLHCNSRTMHNSSTCREPKTRVTFNTFSNSLHYNSRKLALLSIFSTIRFIKTLELHSTYGNSCTCSEQKTLYFQHVQQFISLHLQNYRPT